MQANESNNKELPHKRYFQLCSECGLCNHACTVNNEDEDRGGSSTTPQEIARHLLKLEEKTKQINSDKSPEPESDKIPPTYICTSCELCNHVCPYYVPFFEYLIEGRKWIRTVGAEQLPKTIRDMEQDIFTHGNPFGYPKENRDEWIRDDFPELDKAEVVYYPGCQSAYQLFNIEKAILKILKISGVVATYPGSEDRCCGRPIYFSGRSQDIEKVARSNVESVKGKSARILIASCSSCYLAFKKDYPPIVGKLPFEVYHTTEYFNMLIKEKRMQFSRPLNKKIIYHDPCELGRVGGVIDAPREVLGELPGVKLLEFDNNHKNGLCCGGGGLFEAVDEKEAYSIGEKLVLEAEQKGAEILVTACPTCNAVFNMSKDNLLRNGILKRKIKINDISEIVLKSLKK
jgi:Fe-S oxidoreductase